MVVMFVCISSINGFDNMLMSFENDNPAMV